MLEIIRKNRIVPVVKIEDAGKAADLARAVEKGGLNVIEITFRTEAAEEAIKRIKKEVPEMLVGAGTVLTLENLEKAINAGSDFIVSPGFNPKIVDSCLERNIPVFPGVMTPTEVEAAMDKGLKTLKFFPAEVAGGTAMLKSLSAVYNVDFMPTGGIGIKNMSDYLSLSNVLCVGGSWMVKADLINNEEYEKISQLVREALELTKGE